MCILRHGKKNVIRSITAEEMLPEILRQTYVPKDAEGRKRLLELLDSLLTQVPMWELYCNMEPEAAVVSYEAMTGNKWRKEI